ncbi:MAG TPA: tetratricopeptide repeat protein [Cyclobacteriaceae bacterium]|nr:tetratricopeptide repeat protein [Cyclobacteriaceae bacterium]
MAKVIKFPGSVPEKFGLQRARKIKEKGLEKHGQLNLFSGGKVVRLSKLTPFEEALMLDEHGDAETAMTLYQKAIQQNDSQADAFCNLGILEFKKGDYARAINSFTHCLKLEPRHFEAHYNLANLYAEVGDFALAKFHYQVSIEIEPTFPNSYFNLGLTLAMSKEYAEAISILNRYRDLTVEEDHTQLDSLIFTLQQAL